MKKFLKVFIIVLLVVAVIAGTCYFFFRKNEEKNNTTDSIAAMLQSESKLKFNDDLYTINNIANTDDRIELIIETSENLDEIIFVLATYYVDSDTKINNESISNKLNQVNSSRNLLTRMIKEYTIKEANAQEYFNEHTGLNDFYKQSCNYLVQYATLANLLNDTIDVNKSADFKFNMFEIYCNVVINTFSNTEIVENSECGHIDSNFKKEPRIYISNSGNIDKVNELLKIRNSYIVKIENEGLANEKVEILNSSNVNKFNEFYNKCDKTAFVKNLADNIISVTTAEGSYEKIAAFYFKEIYGI